MTQAVLPAMRRQAAGRIVNIGSVAGFLPMPFQAVYAATKHALAGSTETLDLEVRRFGIRAILIQPGFFRTDLDRSSTTGSFINSVYEVERSRVVEKIRLSVENGDDPDGRGVRSRTAGGWYSDLGRGLPGSISTDLDLLRTVLDEGFESIDQRLPELGPLQPDQFSLKETNARLSKLAQSWRLRP
jgi:NAD(P)-dependent dehydrogenase (short-subunit alcohol dehydrogenase family)